MEYDYSSEARNSRGGGYFPGRSYGPDLRSRVASAVLNRKSDETLTSIADRFQVSNGFVSKITGKLDEIAYASSLVDGAELAKGLWPTEFEQFDITPQQRVDELTTELLFGLPRGGATNVALDWEDVDYVVLRVLQNPFLTLEELQRGIENDLGIHVDRATICRLLSRVGLTRKKATRINIRRFSEENMRIREQVTEYLRGVSPDRVFFWDESGWCLEFAARLYGRAFTRVQVSEEYPQLPHMNLLALIGLGGVVARVVVPGGVTADSLKQAFISHVLPVISSLGRIVIVMDNAKIHRSAEGELKAWLALYGCTLVFLPPYSPDMNPIENFFCCLKTLVRKDRDAYIRNPIDAIHFAIDSVAMELYPKWFRHCGYLP